MDELDQLLRDASESLDWLRIKDNAIPHAVQAAYVAIAAARSVALVRKAEREVLSEHPFDDAEWQNLMFQAFEMAWNYAMGELQEHEA